MSGFAVLVYKAHPRLLIFPAVKKKRRIHETTSIRANLKGKKGHDNKERKGIFIVKGHKAKRKRAHIFLALSLFLFLGASRPIKGAPTAMAVGGRRLIQALPHYHRMPPLSGDNHS